MSQQTTDRKPNKESLVDVGRWAEELDSETSKIQPARAKNKRPVPPRPRIKQEQQADDEAKTLLKKQPEKPKGTASPTQTANPPVNNFGAEGIMSIYAKTAQKKEDVPAATTPNIIPPQDRPKPIAKPKQAATETSPIIDVGRDEVMPASYLLPVDLHSNGVTKKKTIRTEGQLFTLDKILGEGGMGEVYKATCLFEGAPGPDDDIRRDVAVKFMLDIDPALRDRFVSEARLIARLNHENIVRFEGWHYRKEDNKYFVVMEYIKGIDVEQLIEMHNLKSLPHLLEGINRIPDKIAAFVLFCVGNGLNYAHNYNFGLDAQGSPIVGVVHRDVTPGNILIKLDEGAVKLTDFGVAITTGDLKKAEERGEIAGKLAYMAPETFSQFKATTRSDLYSLGVTAYEMLTGFCPNEKFFSDPESAQEYQEQIASAYDKEIVPPHEVIEGIDRDLSDIVIKLMQKDPEQRYQSAAQLVDAVGRQYLYKGGFGPTKVGLKAYIETLKGERSPGQSLDTLRFLLTPRWYDLFLPRKCQKMREEDVLKPYKLKDWARKKVEQGQIPARVW
jgi:serine/threonine-protein kinase